MSAPAPVYAATSSNLNYQARLYNVNGTVVADGKYNVEFKLYNAQSGGSALWTETYYDTDGAGAAADNRVTVRNGYLSANLNSLNNNWGSITDWDQDLWLTLNIGGAAHTGSPVFDGEMSPRIKLTAVPYAFQAKRAETLNKTAGGYTGVLDFLALTQNRNIKLPDQDGTLCIAGSPDCVDVTTTGTTALTSSNSGLEISADGLRLLGGCSDGQMIRWNATSGKWECSSGSGASIVVRESDGSPSTTVTGALEFGPATNSSDEFIITNQGSGVTRIRIGNSILTTTNFGSTLDTAYVNAAEAPAAGDITGSFSAGLTIGANSVAMGTDTTGDYVANLGTVTGLTLSGNTGEGSMPGLSVNYGSGANTAVQGNTQLTCASGTGNLTGGGTIITLGSGGTCAAISTNNAVSFSSSVTTPLVTNAGGLTISTTGSNDLTLTSGSNKVNLNATTVSTTAGLTFDTVNASNTAFTISNTGAGVANLNLADGGLQIGGTDVLNNGRALSNLTGISSSGTVTLSSLSGGGLLKTAAGTGVVSLATAGTDYELPLTFTSGLTRTTNSVRLGGNLTQGTVLGLNSNNLSITGSGTAAVNFASGGGLEILSSTTGALVVRNAAGTTTYFTVNTSGNIVQVGSATDNSNPILFVLNAYNQATDPTGTNGASYYNTIMKRMRCFEDNVWKNCVSSAVASKTADQTITNSAAFTNDPDLKFAMDANSTYTFDATINFSTTSQQADFKYTFTVPAGAQLFITTSAPTSATAVTNCVITTSGQTCAMANTANFRSTMTVTGYVITGATAGDLQYQFAQNSATAGQSVTTYKGSSILWRRTTP